MDTANNILKTQVLIVGAGPSGLSMAAQLQRYGINFIIIEKNEQTTHLSKAIVVQARTLEIFQELSIAQTAVKQGEITTALNMFYKGKRKANLNISNLGKGLSAFPYALSLEQSKTEKLLADYLSTKQIQINWKCEFIRFGQNKMGVSAYYKNANGTEQQVDAQYIVGCDGASSLVRHQMGMKFKGDTVPKLFYVADVILNSKVIDKNELFIFLIPKGFVIFFPMQGTGHYRMIGILPNAKNPDKTYEFTDIEKEVKKQLYAPIEFKELRWFSTYKVHSRKADLFASGRCFIVGDAAHIHTPAGGQGMNTGIQDAYNLAWKLAYSINQKTNQDVLSTYNTERTENAKHLLRTTDKMFDLMAGTTGFWNFVRLHVFPTFMSVITKSTVAKKKIFPLISQIGISYPNSYLTIQSSVEKVKAGMRMPYFIFKDNKDIYLYLTEPNFKLLFFGSDTNAENKLNSLKDVTIIVTTYTFKEIPSKFFGNNTNFYILLRPDNHISYIGKDFKPCIDFLNKISAT